MPSMTAIWDQVTPRYRYQRVIFLLGLVLLASALFHLVVFAIDGGPWWGPVSWRKPVVFGVSFGVTALSLGWVQGLLPRNRAMGWLTTVLAGGAGVFEVGLISAQRWRGVPSHFNVTTPLDATIFSLMGVFVALTGLGIVLLLVWAMLRLRRPASAVIAVLTGLVLLIAGSALGGDLIARGDAILDATGEVPSALLIGVAGSGKLAHAAGIHGLQALGLLELLLGASTIVGSRRTAIMSVAAAGYVTGALAIAAQAYSGRSMLEPTPGVAVALLAALAALGWAYISALRSPQPQRPHPAPVRSVA